eukprot:14079-Heterococcus_DN1.PRE.2
MHSTHTITTANTATTATAAAPFMMINCCFYRRHRQYLERSLQLLGERFSRDVASHRDDNLRVMQDNMLLIKEINEQRDKNRSVKRALQAQFVHITSELTLVFQAGVASVDSAYSLHEADDLYAATLYSCHCGSSAVVMQ